MKRQTTRGFDSELLDAINGWKRLSHTELAIVTQAFYALATHEDVPQWVQDSAEGIAADLRSKLSPGREG